MRWSELLATIVTAPPTNPQQFCLSLNADEGLLQAPAYSLAKCPDNTLALNQIPASGLDVWLRLAFIAEQPQQQHGLTEDQENLLREVYAAWQQMRFATEIDAVLAATQQLQAAIKSWWQIQAQTNYQTAVAMDATIKLYNWALLQQQIFKHHPASLGLRQFQLRARPWIAADDSYASNYLFGQQNSANNTMRLRPLFHAFRMGRSLVNNLWQSSSDLSSVTGVDKLASLVLAPFAMQNRCVDDWLAWTKFIFPDFEPTAVSAAELSLHQALFQHWNHALRELMYVGDVEQLAQHILAVAHIFRQARHLIADLPEYFSTEQNTWSWVISSLNSLGRVVATIVRMEHWTPAQRWLEQGACLAENFAKSLQQLQKDKKSPAEIRVILDEILLATKSEITNKMAAQLLSGDLISAIKRFATSFNNPLIQPSEQANEMLRGAKKKWTNAAMPIYKNLINTLQLVTHAAINDPGFRLAQSELVAACGLDATGLQVVLAEWDKQIQANDFGYVRGRFWPEHLVNALWYPATHANSVLLLRKMAQYVTSEQQLHEYDQIMWLCTPALQWLRGYLLDQRYSAVSLARELREFARIDLRDRAASGITLAIYMWLDGFENALLDDVKDSPMLLDPRYLSNLGTHHKQLQHKLRLLKQLEALDGEQLELFYALYKLKQKALISALPQFLHVDLYAKITWAEIMARVTAKHRLFEICHDAYLNKLFTTLAQVLQAQPEDLWSIRAIKNRINAISSALIYLQQFVQTATAQHMVAGDEIRTEIECIAYELEWDLQAELSWATVLGRMQARSEYARTLQLPAIFSDFFGLDINQKLPLKILAAQLIEQLQHAHTFLSGWSFAALNALPELLNTSEDEAHTIEHIEASLTAEMQLLILYNDAEELKTLQRLPEFLDITATAETSVEELLISLQEKLIEKNLLLQYYQNLRNTALQTILPGILSTEATDLLQACDHYENGPLVRNRLQRGLNIGLVQVRHSCAQRLRAEYERLFNSQQFSPDQLHFINMYHTILDTGIFAQELELFVAIFPELPNDRIESLFKFWQELMQRPRLQLQATEVVPDPPHEIKIIQGFDPRAASSLTVKKK